MFAEPNGTLTAEFNSGPVRAMNASGDWAPINTDLVESNGRLIPTNVPGDLSLSAGGDQAFAKADAAGDGTPQDLAWQWPTTLPEPIVDGPTATYQDAVGEGRDLVVIATPSGFTHHVVLHMPPAAEASPFQLTIPVITPGSELHETSTGALEVKDTDTGKKIATAPAPIMWDASGTDATDPVVEAVNTTVVDTQVGSRLVLTPAQEFLTDPDTIYPVTIDPSYTVGIYSVADTWVDDSTYSMSQASSGELRVGTTNSGATKARAFIKFGIAGLEGTAVNTATMTLRNFASGTCTASSIQAARITEAWNSVNVTWANKPSATTSGQAYYAPAAGADGCPSANATWNVEAIVTPWIDGTAPNNGIRLAAVNENSNNTYRRYRSAEYTDYDGNFRPKLTINYNHVPTAPPLSSLTITPCVNGCPSDDRLTESLTPTLGATGTDSGGGSLTYSWQVRDFMTQALVASGTTPGTSGVAGAWTVPAGLLQPEGLYEFRSGASNTTSAVAWSDWALFGADPDEAPAVPEGLGISPCHADDCSTSTVTSLTPILQADLLADVDSSTLTPTFQVRDGAGTIVASGTDQPAIPSYAMATYQVPPGALQNSTTYEFRVGSSDGTTTVWTNWHALSVSLPASITAPPVIALTSCSTTCSEWQSSEEGATFAATVSNSAPAAGVTVRFEVRSGAYTASGERSSIAPGATTSWTLPPGEVGSGVHEVRAGVVDGNSVAWTGWQPFGTTVPLDPSTSVPTADQGVVDEETEIDVAPPDPAEDVDDTGVVEPFDESDVTALEAEIQNDRYRTTAAGVEENSEPFAERVIPIPEKYAPIVYIHPNEDRWPLSPRTFINHSNLKWRHDGICYDHKITNDVQSWKLGDGVYSHLANTASSHCGHTSYRFRSTDAVYPFANPYMHGTPEGEGMGLDLDDDYKDGQDFNGDEPVYYRYDPYNYITYWFPWGSSIAETPGPNFLGNHEGDWESISILLSSRDNKPLRVRYNYHFESCYLPWPAVPKLPGTSFPRVMAALRSHGSYPVGYSLEDTGIGPISHYDSVSTTGRRWYTMDYVRNVRFDSWFGYNGGWGNQAKFKSTSGPPGPSLRYPKPSFGLDRCGS